MSGRGTWPHRGSQGSKCRCFERRRQHCIGIEDGMCFGNSLLRPSSLVKVGKCVRVAVCPSKTELATARAGSGGRSCRGRRRGSGIGRGRIRPRTRRGCTCVRAGSRRRSRTRSGSGAAGRGAVLTLPVLAGTVLFGNRIVSVGTFVLQSIVTIELEGSDGGSTVGADENGEGR